MIKIAIVEQNKTVRESLEAITNRAEGCRCIGAWGTAEDALQGLRKQSPDVVLMDVRLPSISGVECTAHLKQRLPGSHILLLTVYEDPDRIFHALRAGACGYLLKRSTPEQIIAAIHHAHHGKKAKPAAANGTAKNSPVGELGSGTGAVRLGGESQTTLPESHARQAEK